MQEIRARGLDRGCEMTILDECLRVLKTPNIAIFCSKNQLRGHIDWIERHDLKWVLLSWHKPNPTPLSNGNYLPDTEFILHAWKGRMLTGRHKTKRRYYLIPSRLSVHGHPAEKPIEIIESLIENATDPGDIVLDPFLGSGTTAVAPKKLGRHFIGIEHEAAYDGIANTRLHTER